MSSLDVDRGQPNLMSFVCVDPRRRLVGAVSCGDPLGSAQLPMPPVLRNPDVSRDTRWIALPPTGLPGVSVRTYVHSQVRLPFALELPTLH